MNEAGTALTVTGFYQSDWKGVVMGDKILSYYYTYVHVRNDTNEVFYVGKGKYSKKNIRHASCNGRNPYWHSVVNKAGFTSIIVATWFDESSAFDHEKQLIRQYESQGITLTNMTIGGEGASGWKHSDQAKLKISRAHKGRKLPEWQKEIIRKCRLGKPPSQLSKDRTRETHLGKIRTPEEIEKSAIKRRGMKRSEESKLKMSLAQRGSRKPKLHIPIKCISNGVEYCSITDAAKSLKIPAGNIVRQLKGHTKHCANFVFEYVGKQNG